MPLRVLTINLYTGQASDASFAAALRTHAPDVVAVQELSAGAAHVLRDWGTAHLLDPRDDTTGMGLAARFPIQFERLEFPFRRPIRARFDGSQWQLGPVELVNAHLVNPIARPLGQSRRLRTQELEALEHLLESKRDGARILVGDLNSSPRWPLYRRIAQLASDGAVEAGTARRTWSYFPRTPPLLRIDHVFLQGASCLATQLVRIQGADHRGLLVDIEATRPLRASHQP